MISVFAALLIFAVIPFGPGHAHSVHRRGHAAAADRLPRGGAVHPGGRRTGRVRHRAGWVGLRLDVPADGRRALHRAGHLVRTGDGPVARHRVHVLGCDEHSRDRGRARDRVVGAAAAARLRDLRDLHGGRDQPPPVRPPGGRGRAGRWLHDRVFVDEVRLVLPGRVHEHDQRLRRRVDPVPWAVGGRCGGTTGPATTR